MILKPWPTEGWSELVAWTEADQLPAKTQIGFKQDPESWKYPGYSLKLLSIQKPRKSLYGKRQFTYAHFEMTKILEIAYKYFEIV